MKFGLQLHSFGQAGGILRSSFDDVLKLATWADEAGFDYLAAQDHLAPYPSMVPRDTPLFDVWSVLCSAAVVTRRIQLLPLVVNASLRHPVYLAQQMATLDFISEGRGLLGLGIGGYEFDHGAMGETVTSSSDRVQRLEEILDVLALLFTGEQVSFEGKYFAFRDHQLAPVPERRIEVLIAGQSQQVLGAVARRADYSNFSMVSREGFVALREACQSLERAVPHRTQHVAHTLLDRIVIRETDEAAREHWQAMGSPQRDGHPGIIGSAATVRETLQLSGEAGAEVVFTMFPDAESRQRFAEDVLPAFRAS